MNPAVEHLPVFQLLLRYPFSDQGEFFGLDEVLKDQQSELNAQGFRSIVGPVDSHFPGKYPIGLIEDLNLVTAQMRILGSEGSPANVL
jgi:hypothetical protein